MALKGHIAAHELAHESEQAVDNLLRHSLISGKTAIEAVGY